MNPSRRIPSLPQRIGEFVVLCCTPIDTRHRTTGKTRHHVNGVVQPAMAGLAICRYPDDSEFYLLYCDADWKPVTDTCHSTLEQAKHQAEFEYQGVSVTWIQIGPHEKNA